MEEQNGAPFGLTLFCGSTVVIAEVVSRCVRDVGDAVFDAPKTKQNRPVQLCFWTSGARHEYR